MHVRPTTDGWEVALDYDEAVAIARRNGTTIPDVPSPVSPVLATEDEAHAWLQGYERAAAIFLERGYRQGFDDALAAIDR